MPYWICQLCEGRVVAPQRPRRDSVKRFCLKCSERTGRLVPRICPTLEATRTARAEARRTRTKRSTVARKTTEAARFTICGIDVREEMQRLVRLRAFGGRQGLLAARPPQLKVRRCTTTPRTRLGSYSFRKRLVRIAAYPLQTAADVRETLLHELVHAFVGSGHGHDYAFRAKMREAFQEAYGVLPQGVDRNRYHGRFARALQEVNPAH